MTQNRVHPQRVCTGVQPDQQAHPEGDTGAGTCKMRDLKDVEPTGPDVSCFMEVPFPDAECIARAFLEEEQRSGELIRFLLELH